MTSVPPARTCGLTTTPRRIGSRERVDADLRARGWTKIDPPAAWGLLVADAVDLLMRLPGGGCGYGQQARLHHACRAPASVPRPLEHSGRPLRLLPLTPPAVPFFVSAWARQGHAVLTQVDDQPRPDAGMVTFTLDPQVDELEEALPQVRSQQPPFLLADFPRNRRRPQWEASLSLR